MHHILKRGERYYFNRRVPEQFRAYDSRKYVRISLKTDSRTEALRMAIIKNGLLEQYWRGLYQSGRKDNHEAYEDIIYRARCLGYSYISNDILSISPLHEIMARIAHVDENKNNQHHVVSLLGGISRPNLKLDEALEKFWGYSSNKTYNKTEKKLLKWKYPRSRAIKNFIGVVGNKSITDINRDDILKFRDWWLNRMEEEDLVSNSANKNFIHLKGVLETVSDNLNLNIDIEHLFKKIILTEDDERKRLPFTTEFLNNTLLNSDNLLDMEEQARCALYVFAETGAGASELASLLPDDISLDCEVPHFIIRPKQKSDLKTKYRKRIIPITGYAVHAFNTCPHGFTDYLNDPDKLSATWRRYLKEHKLLPSDRHSVYSLRHSFQDRLLAVNAPDRVQSDLMGHKFNRPSYGDGASLSHKLEWMRKIQLKK